MSRVHVIGLVAVLCLATSRAGGQETTTVLFTFDSAKIGAVVPCDGELSVAGGEVTIRPWLSERQDSVQGTSFKLTSEHDAASAKAAKLARAYRPALSKGWLLEISAPPDATLRGTTKLGDFDVPLKQLRDERAASVLDGKARLQWIPNVTPLTGDQGEEEYPSVAVLPDGRTAVAYVAWDGQTDRVVLRVGDETRVLTDGPGDCLEPRCAADGAGKLWVVWTANDGRQWDLWARSDGEPVRLTTSPLNDFWPRLARDTRGNLWLAWQTVAEDLHYELRLARLGPEGLGEPVNVSDHPADDWEPALCATPDGRLVVAWDTYRNGSFDVYLREFTAPAEGAARPLGPARPVAATALREAHASVAADAAGRVWLAWDVSMEDWGKHPNGGGTLHSWRDAQVAVYADGKLRCPAAGLMESLPEPFTQFIEYPTVAVDGRGRVWVVFRFENRVHPFYTAGGRRAQSYGMWHLFATQFDGSGWSEPVLLDRSNGRQDVRPGVAVDPSGELLVVYAADGRTRQFPYMPVDYDVALASLAGFGTPMGDVKLVAAEDLGQITPAAPDPELEPLPRTWTVGGTAYRCLLGDTHRHTDISRCANGRDGSLQDAYRYALNACGLDWLAISDHDQDILKHRHDRKARPRQDYDWWRSQKYCDLYTIPGRFVALYGYEHGGSYQARGGHKNVVHAERGRPVEEVDAPRELFAALADSGAIAIPHQLADGGSRTDWERWNEEYERVGEIFQARGSYEFAGCPRVAKIYTQGHSMWDALAKGVRIGIVASSDHGQTHQARAGAYVEDLGITPDNAAGDRGFTRRGILDALRARRAFGATIAVVVQVRIGDEPLGRELTVEGTPTIDARIVAPADIVRMDVVRDARFIYTSEPNRKEAAFQFNDLDLKPGQSAYYYVRAQIGENDFAWSSPIWVTREK